MLFEINLSIFASDSLRTVPKYICERTKASLELEFIDNALRISYIAK